MSKNYAVARVVQYTQAGVGKAERHIERKNRNYENMNVDLSQSPRNVHFKSCEDPTYSQHLDHLVEEGTVSLRGLKQDAKVFDEMIFDVNTAYFEEHGSYDYALCFYEEVFRFAEKEYGTENIVSAVMHADELNTAVSEELGYPVYHYHLHVVALPVVLYFNPAVITKVEMAIQTGMRYKDYDLHTLQSEGIYMARPPFGAPLPCLTHFLKNGLFDSNNDKLLPCLLSGKIRYDENEQPVLPCGLSGDFCPHLNKR